jgi:cellobiose phosphorylase
LNPASRRTSEPYCTGNYYCGPGHAREGQNFFTWFTGNPAWLLRIGFDRLLGVRADFDGLRIDPCIPAEWDGVTVARRYRGATYRVRVENPQHVCQGVTAVALNGTPVDTMTIPVQPDATEHDVHVVMG